MPVSTVSETRFARLTKGINLSHWFAQAHSYSLEHLHSYFTQKDAQRIAEMGFVHARLTLNPVILFGKDEPANLDQEMLAELDAAIALLRNVGLAVIVDLHPEDEFKRELRESTQLQTQFAAFWQALAAHLTKYDPEWVFLEVLNEPLFEDASTWGDFQAKLLAAMRAGAPEHTLIATAHRWSGPAEFLELRPVADPNIIYNFHCYEPHDFTHQAATWGAPYWPELSYLPYPSSPEALAEAVARTAGERAKQAAADYGEERWNAEKIDALIGQMAAWGKQHGVRLSCNEFGVYRYKSHPSDRHAWLNDLRSSLEKHQIGWTMWDYAGGFSVVTGEERQPDPETLRALGL